jgi:glycosyltransferase involved in cell wall biosynthesis
MKISVIIPAYNEEKLLPATLDAVARAQAGFHRGGWTSEVIVCDNNSTDRTAEIARQMGAKVVFEPVNQIGRARNRGASIAEGEWLQFVDADSLPSVELFEAVAQAIASGKVLAGGSTVRLDAPGASLRILEFFWNLTSRMGRLMAGSFIFVEAAAFREMGGFSPTLFAGEELELTMRLRTLARRSGRKIVILNAAPLCTSARKMKLYSKSEMFRFLFRAILRPKATQTSREACWVWYDGRR